MATHTIEISDSEDKELSQLAQREGVRPRTLLAEALRDGLRARKERLTLAAAAAPVDDATRSS